MVKLTVGSRFFETDADWDMLWLELELIECEVCVQPFEYKKNSIDVWGQLFSWESSLHKLLLSFVTGETADIKFGDATRT